MISFTLLYRSTMQIVFPNVQAALDHIKEHKGREVLIVDSHDGSKYDSGKWPYTQFNCIKIKRVCVSDIFTRFHNDARKS